MEREEKIKLALVLVVVKVSWLVSLCAVLVLYNVSVVYTSCSPFSRVERKGIHSGYNTTLSSLKELLYAFSYWVTHEQWYQRNEIGTCVNGVTTTTEDMGCSAYTDEKKDGCYYILRNRNKDFTFVTFTDANLLLFLFLRSFLIIVLFQRQGAGRNLENGREEQLQLSVCNLNFTHKKNYWRGTFVGGWKCGESGSECWF